MAPVAPVAPAASSFLPMETLGGSSPGHQVPPFTKQIWNAFLSACFGLGSLLARAAVCVNGRALSLVPFLSLK